MLKVIRKACELVWLKANGQDIWSKIGGTNNDLGKAEPPKCRS